MRKADITVKNQLVWIKPFVGLGSHLHAFGSQYEVVLFGTCGNYQLAGYGHGDIWLEPVGPNGCFRKGKQHPTEKPLTLMSYLLSRAPGEPVLDPFMGSGTTLRAAKDLGRKAIGIEIEERYCEIAAERLSQEVLPL